MYTIGINAYHGDSSACLFRDNELIGAVEEERFTRVKHWAGVPLKSLDWLLSFEGISLNEIDYIAVNQDSTFHRKEKFKYILTHKPDLKLVFNRLKNRLHRRRLVDVLSEGNLPGKFKGKFINVEHHLAHLASAYYVSPFDNAAILSVDGFGDFSSTALGVGKSNDITILDRVLFPHSLGIFYQALTQYLGFPNYGDEYKVMGLAPYGEPKFVDTLSKVIEVKSAEGFRLDLSYFKHHNSSISTQWEGGSPTFDKLYSAKLIQLLGKPRSKDEMLTQKHFDIAHSVQKTYENALFGLLDELYKRTGLTNLTLAGGCAMNSVANGKICLNTKFKNIYIQSAAGDAGGAIGAALVAINKNQNTTNKLFQHHTHAYWGPCYSNEQIRVILEEFKLKGDVGDIRIELISDYSDIASKTALAISEGKVIGWFQGRMEWGPRALGNRSIICDPRRADMKNILNSKIKRRESFRPFAPSILKSDVATWFEQDDDVPFMMQVFQIKEKMRSKIPAVTHVDGSGRLQTVDEATNPRYYKLIEQFKKLTDIPMVLNTSFNENEPVVCSPNEAFSTFLRTKMDILVMNNWFIERTKS